MAAMSDYLENALINHILRNTAHASPSKVYVALYTSNPTDADTGTEVSGGGYERLEVTFGAPTDGATSNTQDLIWPVATADWGTVTHVGIRDAATGGNLLFHAPLAVPKHISTGDQFIIRAGDLDVSLA